MTLLYGLLPPLMAWQLRQKLRSRQAAADRDRAAPASAAAERLQGPLQEQQQLWWRQHEDMVPGGLPVLGAMFGAACVIEVSRLADDAGLTGGPGNATLQARGGPDGGTSEGMAVWATCRVREARWALSMRIPAYCAPPLCLECTAPFSIDPSRLPPVCRMRQGAIQAVVHSPAAVHEAVMVFLSAAPL